MPAEADPPLPPRAVVVMGVSGAGKSTVGRLLAERLDWRFVDGDDLHPRANIEKMAAGHPLDDEDRRPWLLRVRAVIEEHLQGGPGVVIACSALKRSYRRILGIGDPGVALLFLDGSSELLEQRLQARKGHFMPPGLLNSQLATLERPRRAVRVEITTSAEEIAAQAQQNLGLGPLVGRTENPGS